MQQAIIKWPFMVLTSISVLGSAAIAPSAFGQGLDFSITEDTVKAQVWSEIPYNDLSWSAEFLHYDDGGIDANILGGGVFVAGRSNASTARQVAGLGGKLLIIDAEGGDNGSVIAPGGFVRHTLSQANLVSVRGEIFFAPSIISFQGVENYLEYSVRAEYQLLDQANVYLGYRSTEAEVENERGGTFDFEFEQGVMAGVALRF